MRMRWIEPILTFAMAISAGLPARAADLTDPSGLTGLPAAVERGDFPKTNAVLIVSDGQLVYERYFNNGGPDVLNNTRSATKSVTSLVIGVAIDQGAITSAKDRAFGYLRDLAPFANDTPDKDAITIEDLLTMSSALDCNDDVEASPGNEDKMHPQPNWTRWAVDLPTARGYRRDAAGFGPWRYCTTGAFLLGQVVERATRVRVDRYIDAKIFGPLGITRRAWSYSPSGEAMTGGGIELTARDLAKLAWMVEDGGRWRGRQVVPAAWVDAALTQRRTAYPGVGYGYFFWRRTFDTRCGPADGWYMAGNGGNAIVILRDLRAAVVVARTNYGAKGMHDQTKALLETYVLPALKCPAIAQP
jgi:CubicO group peptidase (beta-lactamase class C family)